MLHGMAKKKKKNPYHARNTAAADLTHSIWASIWFSFSNKPGFSDLRAFVRALPCPWNAFPAGFSPILGFHPEDCSLNSKASKSLSWTILILN